MPRQPRTQTTGNPAPNAPPSATRHSAIAALVLPAALALTPPPAHAVDGCLVLLCLAAPSWGAIPQCIAPVRQVLRDLARGRLFPTCGMSGATSTAHHRWATAPDFCPPQYTTEIAGESASSYTCDYAGAVSVSINGTLWARTWWNFGGNTVTEFTAAAKASLGSWNTTFDDDYAAWARTGLPAAPASTPDCGGCGA